jgi:hypothetical protein
VPFAGHPNVGTAVVFAKELEGKGAPPLDRLILEEAAGLVPIRLICEAGKIVGAVFTAPEALTLSSKVGVAAVAGAEIQLLQLSARRPEIGQRSARSLQRHPVVREVPSGRRGYLSTPQRRHFRLLLLDRRSDQKLGSFWRYGTMNHISSRGAGTTSLIAREQRLHILREGLSIGIRQADS